MNQEAGIESYVRNPRLLVDLILEVVDRFGNGQDEPATTVMETQLREVAKAIDNLDKAGIAIPDALRAEKTRLAATLGIQAEAMQALSLLTDELDDIVKNLKSRLGNEEQTTEKMPRKKRSRSTKTDNATLRQLMIEALQHLGGSSQKNEVLKYVEQKLQGKLLPGDLEWRDSCKSAVWQNNACWERYKMIEDGILKNGSPRGIWELSEEHQ
jgi:hypothetical protein